MSDSKVNNNLIKSRDIIPPSKELADPFNPSQSITSTTELLIEFLSAVMTKDYELALRYCTEILNREPDNLTALEFYPLIVEKLEMIENEDNSLSDSSVSSSSATSSSSCSEKKLFQNEFIDKASSLYEWGVSRTSFMEHMTQEKIDEGGVPSRTAPKKESTNENIKMESKSSLGARSKKTSLPNAEQCKKKTRSETPPPENLLIHPTQTLTLISNNTSNKGSKTLSRPKQERRTPHVSQQQPPSKILLHTTQTVTFPKKMSIQNSERTGNPQ